MTLKTVSYMGPIINWMLGIILASYFGSCLLSWRTAPFVRLAVGSILLVLTTILFLAIMGVFDEPDEVMKVEPQYDYQKRLFTGREWIGEIGIYDYRNRVYSPELGRFLQTDPIRFEAGDVNLYRYVGNSPIDWVDEQGLQGGRPRQRSPRRNKSPGITGGSLVHAGILWYYVKKGLIPEKLGHCQAHCEMAKEFGQDFSKWAGDTKEDWDRWSKTGGPDHDGDEAANKKGRACASDPCGCMYCCINS
jgi:RHS repeat-associated protein